MNGSVPIEGFTHNLAFLVAIDGYRNGVPPLRTPVADAEALAKCLTEDHGFDTQLILNSAATLVGLRKFLEELPKRVGRDDRVLFYFAGHGTAIDNDKGATGYILPQDADRDSESKYLPMLEISNALSALECRHMLVILDCCFAGAFRWASTRHLALAPEHLHQERYRWFISDPAWQAIASAAHDQKALDVAAERPLGKRDDRLKHSPFAAALIDGLQGAADRAPVGREGDGVITATELYQHLVDALLPRDDAEFRQTPIFWPLKKDDKGQFVFLVPGRELDLPLAPPLDPDANPWRGLDAYEEKDKDLFYGRRTSVDRLAERLLGREESHDRAAIPAERFIVVTGPSGIGKSSLIKAGLLPRLKDALGGQLVQMVVRPGKPGPTPFASLSAALRQAMPAEVVIPDAATFASKSDALANWFEVQDSSYEFVLVVDQAEELITVGNDPEVARQFNELIAQALKRAHDNLRVVFTVRSEFEPQFSQSPLSEFWPTARYLVPQMTQDELRRVIEGPAAVKVMRFESAELVDTLVNEVVNMPGALPLLSFALSQMYMHYLDRRGSDRALTKEDYAALGGLTGKARKEDDLLKGGVTGALHICANRVVDDGDEQYKASSRRVLERFVSLEAGEFARRRVPRWEFEPKDPDENYRVREVIKRLDKERLVITDEADATTYFELAHDALILSWDKLLTWVRQDAPLIADLRRLTLAAQDWHSSGRRKSYPVWANPAQITTIKALQITPYPGLNQLELEFAQVSIKRAWRNRALRLAAVFSLIGVTFLAGLSAYVARERQRLAISRQAAAQSQLLAQRTDRLSEAMLVAAPALALSEELSSRSLEAGQVLRAGLALLPTALYDLEPDGGVHEVRFTPDSKHIITWREYISIYDTENFRLISSFNPSASINSFGFVSPVFSQDATHFGAAIGNDVAVWDIFTAEIRHFSTPAYVSRVALSPDAHYVAALTNRSGVRVNDQGASEYKNALRVWNVQTGELLIENTYEGREPWDIAFSDSAKYLAVLTDDGAVTLWRPDARELVARLEQGGRPIRVLSFSSDGRYLLTAGDDALARVWNVDMRRKLIEVGVPDSDAILSASISADGRYVATAHREGTYRVWSVESGQQIARLDNQGSSGNVSFSPDSKFLVTTGPGSISRVWNWELGIEVARTNDGYSWGTFSSDGRYLASANGAGARVWRWPNNNPLFQLKVAAPGRIVEPNKPKSLAIDKSGRYLARSGPEGGVWDLREGTKIATFKAAGVTFSPDGHFMATASFDAAYVFSVGDNRQLCAVPRWSTGNGEGIYEVRLSGDGRYLAVLSSDYHETVQIWNVTDCSLIARLVQPGDGVLTFDSDFSEDGTRLVTVANGDVFARVWSVTSGKALFSLKHSGRVEAAAFSPNGLQVATAADGWVRIWNATTGLLTAQMEISGANMVIFNPDSSEIVSAGDSRIRVWTLDGTLKAELGHEAGLVESASFSPDGRYLASSASDGQVRIWDVSNWQEVDRIPQAGRESKVVFGAGGRLVISASRVDPDRPDIPAARLLQASLWKSADMIRALCSQFPDRLTPEKWKFYFPTETYRDVCLP
ncbi:caspase family protein [Mesorhizobium sp. WSM2561]|uniref:nSTAND1 domain-containing NTPase n=1 Tax=Mesorhizobium sp. WSM2561 TaxID=1040985 RepID=UPI0004B229D0|nr:caspase family protein [Mesorhizobium sp. WSM2561]